jgi:hypothetical protein
MTRVHTLVLIFLLFTVVIHATLVHLASLISRRVRTKKGPSQSPPAVGSRRRSRTTHGASAPIEL